MSSLLLMQEISYSCVICYEGLSEKTFEKRKYGSLCREKSAALS